MSGRNILVATIGSHGDVFPFIALALALRRAGFKPCVATFEAYRERIEALGLPFHPLSADPEVGLDARTARRLAEDRDGTFFVEKIVLPQVPASYAELEGPVAESALVVAHCLLIGARYAGEKHDVPVVSILLQPLTLPSATDPACLPGAHWLPGFRRVFGAGATRLLFDGLRRSLARRWGPPLNAFRGTIGLPEKPGVEVIDGPLDSTLAAGLYSPLLAPLPADAPPNAFIAGYGFFNGGEDEAGALPGPLAAFLEAGPPPLVFSLGSFVAHGGADFYRASAQAARALGRRAVLLVAPGTETEVAASFPPSEDMVVAGYVPHSLIFPRAAAIVHHAGIGTTGQALRAGRPQLACPSFADQFDNAARLVRLGVARRLDLERYTTERATKALRALLDDPRPERRAAEVGAQVAKEDGPAVVAERIGALLDARAAA